MIRDRRRIKRLRTIFFSVVRYQRQSVRCDLSVVTASRTLPRKRHLSTRCQQMTSASHSSQIRPGAPGSLLPGGDFHVIAPFSRTTTGGPLLGGIVTPLQYVVDLGTGINISPETVCWVSITNNVGADYGWVWANTAGAYDQGVASTYGSVSTGPWQVSSGGGMFFELYNTNVPEPTTFWIALAAVSGLPRLRLKHRSRSSAPDRRT